MSGKTKSKDEESFQLTPLGVLMVCCKGLAPGAVMDQLELAARRTPGAGIPVVLFNGKRGGTFAWVEPNEP